ncbi:ankyrin repeat and fibronectin type-III domain-containing protein 1 isoform X2 [Bombus pascuorum]|uniref:ankyrin repeat and fibronectin type-III domain-containing protein 1 isoform X2 n=2 Tax=Bombus pascuorum TaxID=65598 RepID=UPI00298E3B9D|nr:ankyrin repeat and fibronectin type-III domain-containing protein 1 isoform X2 [Bombus pascuorum]
MIGRGGRRYEGWAVLGGLGRRMSSGDKASPGLTIDRAAFLLLRVKKAFKKKKQQRKEKSIPTVECKTESRSARGPGGRPAPLLRSRTLPAIVAPGLSILQAQIDARYNEYNALLMITAASAGLSVPESGTSTKRGSTVSHCTKLLTPRISFTDDTIERRVSDSGPTRESSKEHSTRSGRLSTSSIGGSQPLTRLARLLNQRPSFTPSDEIPRRLSWERRDCSATSSCLPRSSSIDSVAEWSIAGGVGTVSASNAVNAGSSYGLFADQPPPRRSPSPLLGARSDRLSLVSPNIGRRVKGHRAVLELYSLQGMEFLEGFGKKKQQPNQQSNNISSVHINPLTAQSLNIHLHALFAAVEHGHLDKARTILESTDVDVNSVNSDGLSPLDVAVLSNNRPLAKMLVAFGAQEGNQFKSPESLGSHLASLLLEAEHRVQELGGSTSGSGGTTLLEPPSSHRSSFSSQHNNLTGCGGSAEDKQLALWERRARALRKMLLGFDQARPPDMPFLVAVDVTGTNSVTVRFQEPDSHDSPICTKFKVQWSIKEDFSVICGEREVLDMKQRECRIDDLIQGQKYYFRAAAGNLKGYSRFRNSTPAHVTPSSWRDIDGRVPRFAGRLEQLNTLFTDIRRPEYTQETPAVQRRNHKKKTTIKQLFSATSKFQKNLRRGVFLACLLYHEDKILVTNEDFLPVIEVDETYPSCIYNDFHWLMKVGCTWDDVKILRQNMEKSHSSSTNHFRIKLLQAAAQMQAALCIQDIGQLYHKPIRDVQGTLVFSTVNYVKSPKLISVLNSRWLPLSKVTKKVIIHEDSNVADILIASIQEQMTYHQVSSIKLSKGLYLGYLKMQSSVDLIQVVVPAKSPNVLPHCKIRDNPHVSAEEWDYLKRITRIHASDASVKDCEEKENVTNEAQGTEQQKLFVDLVAATARRLFNYMEISPEDSLLHRLYDAEVIDLTHDVSFLIAVPPAETACCVPGTREILLQRGDLLSLPIQVFEMVHLNTYQKDVINRYSRLSCILELDTAQAQYNHREAFSSLELSVAKDKLARLQDLQTQVNTVWKGARWLIDVITFARDRGSSQQSGSSQTVGISMKHLLSLDRNRSNSNSLKRSLLQLPPRDPKLVKSSPGRGSWPGPNMSNSSSNLLTTEFSKSEQQLPSGQYIRKGSNTSNVSAGSEPAKSTVPMSSPSNLSNATSTGSNNHLVPLQNTRLPPSKSEDTLILTKYKHSPRNRSATITSASASTSPLLSIKPMIYGGSLLSVSTAMTNTTSLLSVSNTNSDSLHSLSSDEYSTPNSSVCIKSGHTKSKPTKPTASVAATATGSLESQLEEEKDEATLMPAPLPGILQVYAAYETGLASGTSLKLHVTPRTTAREVVNLVVKQLNMAVVLKGQEGPIYTADELPNFCLVAVIGARERCLRDDFKLLQLQNPWKKGRLYVRQKQDVLAALEHSSKHTAYL